MLGCSFPILQSFESKSAIVGSWGPSSISLYHSLNTGLSSRLFRKLVPSRVPKIQENISRDKNQSQIEMDGKGLSEQIGTQNSRKNGLERIKSEQVLAGSSDRALVHVNWATPDPMMPR